MNRYLNLFLTFLKIGAFTFGGGYAMIALIENEFVSKKLWIDKDEFIDMVAIAESTPGPIAVNSATYIGYRVGGFYGGALSTLAVCLPSFTVIYIISLFFNQFLSLTYVAYAFKGIQVCVIYLILSAGIKMFRSLEHKPFNITVLIIVSVLMLVFSAFSVNFSSILFILISGVLGLIASVINNITRKDNVSR